MQPPLTLVLGAVFLLLAAINPYLMLREAKHSTARARQWQLRAHRLIGYSFIFLYCTITYHMVLRLKGLSDELSPRNLVHASLALILVPLLVAKITVARYYRAQTLALKVLGWSIAGISYLIVTISAGAYLLRSASPATIPTSVSIAAICTFGVVLIALLVRRPRSTSKLNEAETPTPTSATNLVTLHLAHVQRQTADAKTLRFLLPANYRFGFLPGQFLNFKWDIDGKPVQRCYSICSSPTRSGYIEITPKQTPNGYVSVFLNQKARVGLTVEVSGPGGQFFFDESEHRRIVLIAGGSGITPFMSMLRYIDDKCLPTEVTLLYFVRTRKDIIFEADLKLLQSRLPSFHFLMLLSQPDPGWIGLTGHLTRDLIEINVEDIPSCTFFLCGPPAMMKSAQEVLQSLNVSPTRIKQESFGAAPASVSARDYPFIGMALVEFARSKQTQMASSSASLLETAEACGISMPYSCRQGQCGTCATKLLKGRIHMQCEEGLTPELKQGGYVLPCVSHPQGDVTIDA